MRIYGAGRIEDVDGGEKRGLMVGAVERSGAGVGDLGEEKGASLSPSRGMGRKELEFPWLGSVRSGCLLQKMLLRS